MNWWAFSNSSFSQLALIAIVLHFLCMAPRLSKPRLLPLPFVKIASGKGLALLSNTTPSLVPENWAATSFARTAVIPLLMPLTISSNWLWDLPPSQSSVAKTIRASILSCPWHHRVLENSCLMRENKMYIPGLVDCFYVLHSKFAEEAPVQF